MAVRCGHRCLPVGVNRHHHGGISTCPAQQDRVQPQCLFKQMQIWTAQAPLQDSRIQIVSGPRRLQNTGNPRSLRLNEIAPPKNGSPRHNHTDRKPHRATPAISSATSGERSVGKSWPNSTKNGSGETCLRVIPSTTSPRVSTEYSGPTRYSSISKSLDTGSPRSLAVLRNRSDTCSVTSSAL